MIRQFLHITVLYALSNNDSKLNILEEPASHISEQNPICDVLVSGAICYGDGNQVILPPSRRQSSQLYIDFEESRPIDQSGNANHGIGVIEAGPGHHGGSSGIFTTNFISFDLESMLNTTRAFTVTMWLFRMDINGAQDRFCPIVRFGELGQIDSGISLEMNPENGALQMGSETITGKQSTRLNGSIIRSHWSHVAISTSGGDFTFYLNGVADTSGRFSLSPAAKLSHLILGNNDQSCLQNVFIDDFWLYDEVRDHPLIIAEASTNFRGHGPGSVELACLHCKSLDEAISRCKTGYSICHEIDWYNGVYEIALMNGYDVSNKISDSGDTNGGIAFCCRS